MTISTHALTEGDLNPDDPTLPVYISTHALTEGDRKEESRETATCISTHALTEGDERMQLYDWVDQAFQLTPSRRATRSHYTERQAPKDFNSRPHGGRR